MGKPRFPDWVREKEFLVVDEKEYPREKNKGLTAKKRNLYLKNFDFHGCDLENSLDELEFYKEVGRKRVYLNPKNGGNNYPKPEAGELVANGRYKFIDGVGKTGMFGIYYRGVDLSSGKRKKLEVLGTPVPKTKAQKKKMEAAAQRKKKEIARREKAAGAAQRRRRRRRRDAPVKKVTFILPSGESSDSDSD